MFQVVTTAVYILNINLHSLRISYTFIVDFVIADKYIVGIIISTFEISLKKRKENLSNTEPKHNCYFSKHGIREGPLFV